MLGDLLEDVQEHPALVQCPVRSKEIWIRADHDQVVTKLGERPRHPVQRSVDEVNVATHRRRGFYWFG